MLSQAIRGNVEEDGALDPRKRENAEQVDRLLISLVQRSKSKTSNRESRAAVADLFDITKLRALREVFEKRNRSDHLDDDLSIGADDFKHTLSKFVGQKEV